jgi:membrane fusion protein, copper/silver efflux system
MKLITIIAFLVLVFPQLSSCRSNEQITDEPVMYTCPMPEDSVFSDKPGQCPKCGMQLIEVQHQHGFSAEYTCAMHPEVVREAPGQCPVCGMELVKKVAVGEINDPQVHTVLRSTDAAVLTSLPVTTINEYSGESATELFGTVGYDPRQLGVISSFITGRIEKLYVRYRFQPVEKGQPLMDIYSPELLTAQQELLFLLTSDPSNATLIQAAQEKLHLLGMSNAQLNSVIRNRKPVNSVTVYSRYTGHIHDAGTMEATTDMSAEQNSTKELAVREGSYVEKGKPVFTIVDHRTVWALFQVRAAEASSIKVGDKILITADMAGNHVLESAVAFINPFFKSGEQLLTIRASLRDHQHLPAGTPLKGIIKTTYAGVKSLPRESVISLGVRQIVYVRKSGIVKPVEVVTGRKLVNKVEIVSGLSTLDSVIINGQYLADNETLIRIKK